MSKSVQSKGECGVKAPFYKMYPDLKEFSGKQRDEICRQLKNEGYEILRRGSLCTVFHQPGSTFAVRVSMTPNTAALMCDVFQKNAHNPYLPKVYDHLIINEQAHVSVIEKLVSLEELAEEDSGHTNFGIARAVSSFAYGDKIHGPVHEAMACDPQLIAAIRTLVDCARTAYQQHGDAGDSMFVDRDVDGILFRVDDQGGTQPVFANSLCYTTPSPMQEDEFQNILTRMQDFENAQTMPPAVVKRPTSPVPA